MGPALCKSYCASSDFSVGRNAMVIGTVKNVYLRDKTENITVYK
jgi:hypothetical protein